MSQDDVLAVFGPGEKLTRAEIVARCVKRGLCARTADVNVSAARKTGKIDPIGIEYIGRLNRGVFRYQVVG